MNFRRLEIFYETAKSLSMTEAGKILYISQPSVSQAIKELEEEIDSKLFDRIGKRLYLTHEGEVFLIYVRRILNLYEEGNKILREINDGDKGKIYLGASSTIGTYILPEIMKDYCNDFKNIDISLNIANTESIENLVLNNKVDFGFIEGKLKSDEIIKTLIWEDEIVFICSKDHEFGNLDIVDESRIKNEKLIVREKGSGSRDTVNNYLDKNHIKYNIAMELGNSEAIIRTVKNGLGIGCISSKCIENTKINDEINIFRLKNHCIERKLYLIIHKDKFVSKNMKNFIRYAMYGK
ncbi:MAG: LysR substrate-binding domain-containing protein [Clostridium perfringens]|nr:LysR substrate-binding domain-containing protein [Clostridium perfringens]